MNPENQNQMNPDQAAAALAMATRISEGVMPKNPPPQLEEEMPMEETEEVVEEPAEESAEPVEEPVEEEPEESEEAKRIDDLSKNFESFKGEVKGIIETQFSNLTKSIEDAIK